MRVKVFISHAHAESGLAESWQRLLVDIGANQIEVFSSSDERPHEGIEPGEWLQQIERHVDSADVVLALITTRSKNNAWIAYECGLGRKAGKLVLPICYELGAKALPGPFSAWQSYQGARATDVRKTLEIVGRQSKPDPLVFAPAIVEGPIQSHLEETKTFLAAHPFVENLVALIDRFDGSVVQRISEGGGIAVVHPRFGDYTAFLAEVIDELMKEPNPACHLYNVLQPNAYVRTYEGDRKFNTQPQRKLADVAVSPTDKEDFARVLVRDSHRVFPSIRKIETLMKGELRSERFTILTETASKESLWFLDQLMRCSASHFVLDLDDVREALGTAHCSDFSVWENDGVLVVTDYYDVGQTLVVSWHVKPHRPPTDIKFYLDILDRVRRSRARRPIADLL